MDKNRPLFHGSYSLSAWLVSGVGAFVVLGSVVWILFFHSLTRREEENSLRTLGRNNAMFVEQARLPQSEAMAERMGMVMGARVEFRDAQADALYDEVQRDAREMRVGYALRGGREVWFTRDRSQPGMRPFWKRWDAWAILVGFWLLSVLFVVWLGRRVTRPLGRLAAALPGIGADAALADLPTQGPAEILALAAALRDTQASIRNEREKRRQAERLALLGRMAASLAHEVRNPVAAIRLHAQLLERAVAAADRTSAELIIAESGRIESLVAQWLSYAKPGSLAVRPVHISALAQETAHRLAARAAHAGVSIHVEAGGSEPPVSGDAERLRQVLGNLVLNAIQSMPHGGSVAVRVSREGVEITDEGGGFSQEALDRLGEPFHSEREGGMGLGLAVSKEIIEAHGGRLEAKNREGRGAMVCIHWPEPGTGGEA